jgi:hypothetical protein
MNVTEIKEHEDGSATYQFDMTAEEHRVMCQQGILWCIVAGITGATPEKVMEAWLDEREDKESVPETTEGSCQKEAE